MRSRLLGVVLALVVLVLVGMGVPLGRGVAATEQQEMFLDRLTDTARFASLVQRPVIDDQPEVVLPELKRYSELYGIDVVLLRRDGQVALSSADREPDLSSPAVQETVRGALAGRLPSNPDLVMPWQDHPLVVAEPVLVDGEVRGAVVTFSPTGKTRTGVALWWLAILAGALGALALAVLAALPLVRWMLRPVRALDDATSGLVGAIVSGRPVPPVGGASGPPELRQLGRSFDQMAASVGDVLAAQRAFVADASHQLRNPLTALKLRLSNLEDAVTEEGRPHQAAALAEANRLNRILDEMLAMARAESSSVAPVEVDVDRAVAGRLTAWMPAATARDVHLVLGGEPGRVALAPPRGVETVLDALLDNALKFTAEGTLVHVVVRRADGRVRISVVDEGPGLDEEEMERATDRFWRSPSHQNVAGSGLGLSIVRRVVERVGGRVRLFRGDEVGLGVEVDFPASG